jgi:hypothetical protein
MNRTRKPDEAVADGAAPDEAEEDHAAERVGVRASDAMMGAAGKSY